MTICQIHLHVGDQVIIDLIIFLKLGYLYPDRGPILYIYITMNYSYYPSLSFAPPTPNQKASAAAYPLPD